MFGKFRHQRRPRSPGKVFKQGGEGDRGVPLRATLLGFARHMLKALEIDRAFLTFLFSLLGAETGADVERCVVGRRPKHDGRPGSGELTREAKSRDPDMDPQSIAVAQSLEELQELMGRGDEDDSDACDRAGRVAEMLRRRPFLASRLETSIRSAIRGLRRSIGGSGIGGPPAELECLRRVLGLSGVELDILLFHYCYLRSTRFETLCDRLMQHASSVRVISACTGHPEGAIRKGLSSKAALQRTGLIVSAPSHVGGGFCVDEAIRSWLSGDMEESLEDRFYRVEDRPTFPLDSFEVDPADLQILLAMLASATPCSILLEGIPGTGKTEFARTLAAVVDKKACFTLTGEKGDANDRRVALNMAAGLVPSDRGVLVVDEADSLLRNELSILFGINVSGGVDKGWVNDFLDHAQSHTIWITNEVSGIPESIRRRFSYSLRFSRFSRRQRERCLQRSMAGTSLQGLLDGRDLAELSARHNVSAAGIAGAVQRALQVLESSPGKTGPSNGGTGLSPRQVLDNVLSRHAALTGAQREEVYLPTSRYDLTALNTDVAPSALLKSAEAYLHTSAWGNKPDSTPMNLLFWGLPGTGKTEFARFLASKLGIDLQVRRASDLLDMYVGESEKRIRQAFADAQQSRSILMIDEADSLLARREGAVRNWEVSTVNELLSGMENHRGILVCSTNLLHNLDRAALRRFAWKVEFKPLAAACRRGLYDRHFRDLAGPIPAPLVQRLQQIPNLTFGDLAAVLTRVRFLPPGQATHEALLAMLEKEARYRDERSGTRLGFGT